MSEATPKTPRARASKASTATTDKAPAAKRAPARRPATKKLPEPPKTVPPTSGARGLGRIPVADVFPIVDNGNRPAKSVVGEEFDITASVYREGHDAVNANVVLTDPTGATSYLPMTCSNPGLDFWQVTVSAPTTGRWSFRVEGWSDPYGTWHHDAAIKIAADVDTEMMLEEGALVLERAVSSVERTPEQAAVLTDAIGKLRDRSHSPGNRLGAGVSHAVEAELAARPLRDYVTPSPDYPWLVERERALYGAWYEFFPRSEGCELDPNTGLWKSGTFATAAERLPAVAGMGFDVIYLTPIHPIGTHQPQGPQQHADHRRARSGFAVRDRIGRGWPRCDPPGARHLRRFRRLRRQGHRTRSRGGSGPGPAVRARSSLGDQQSGVVHHPQRRHHRVRGEPAEEVPGHLPAELRQRPQGHLRRDPPGGAGLDRPRGQDLPGRQPAHQAGRVLGVADR